MRSSSPRALRSFLVLVELLLLLACSSGDSAQTRQLGRGVYVPASWEQARRVPGHDVHVVKERVACSACHSLSETELGAVSPARCASCHEKEARISHAAAEASARFQDDVKSDCTFCHRFTEGAFAVGFENLGDAPSAHAHRASDCLHCHATRQALTPAVRIHDTGECLDCHRPHDDATPQSGPCAKCHADIQPTHALAGKTPNQICTTCHQQQHAEGAAALGTCVPCHEKSEPIVAKTALFEGGHVACVGCHQPHQFGKEKAVDCRHCHEDISVLGAGHASGHRECTSCHAAHDVKGSPDRACARCHTDKHPDHPLQGKVGTCVGCHDPHPAGSQAKTRVRACSSCHQSASSDKALHAGVACQRCHQPHDFVRDLSDHRACEGCHGAELASVQGVVGHRACEGCHTGLPHRPELGVASCAACHADRAKLVNLGHQSCTSCHEPHGGRVAVACGNCHQKEQRTAPDGHRDCRSCHEPHAGGVSAPCASCHAKEAQTPHGRLSTTCSDCHRPHGPAGPANPPACTTCHETAKLAGLHRVQQHASCERCHGGHDAPVGARREGCLSCHRDRKQHFPEAPSCASCHLFSPTR